MHVALQWCGRAADFQKDWFKRQPGNKSEFVRTGFYYWCQFPNYAGEIAIWWAMFFWAGFPDVFLSHPWIIISPIFTTVLLRWGSGVATLEASQLKRYAFTPLAIVFSSDCCFVAVPLLLFLLVASAHCCLNPHVCSEVYKLSSLQHSILDNPGSGTNTRTYM